MLPLLINKIAIKLPYQTPNTTSFLIQNLPGKSCVVAIFSFPTFLSDSVVSKKVPHRD